MKKDIANFFIFIIIRSEIVETVVEVGIVNSIVSSNSIRVDISTNINNNT